jgi:hypothetical protein
MSVKYNPETSPGDNGRTGVMSTGFDGNIVYGKHAKNALPLDNGPNVRYADGPTYGEADDHGAGCCCALCDD